MSSLRPIIVLWSIVMIYTKYKQSTDNLAKGFLWTTFS